jgi:hypothetical protein
VRIPLLAAETRQDFRALLLEALPVLFIFTILSRMVARGLNHLSQSAFEGPSILAGGLGEPRFVILVMAPPLLLVPFWKRLRWKDIEGAPDGIRWFIFAVCMASAWTFATYDYNLFLDQAHTADRLILLAVAAASIWHPVFAAIYAAVGMLIVYQFEFPLGLFDWLDKRILFVVLHMFTAFLAMGVVRRQRATVFVGLAASMLAANYFFPGIAKIRTGWLFQDNLANLAVMTHLNGWMGGIDTETFVAVVDRLSWVNKPLLVATLVIELGALLLFLDRRFFIAIVIGTIGLHVGIFLSSGICFWKWVLFNIGVLVLVQKAPDRDLLFTRGFLTISILAILSTPFNARPTWLAWYDTPADEFTEFEVIGASGTEYHVERGFFEPHDLVFSQNRFYFMNREPTLLGTFGATVDAGLDRDLTAARSPDAADSLIRARAVERYDEAKSLEFQRYLTLFFATLNERGTKELWMSRLRAPHHIWSQRREPVYAAQEPVVELKVVFHRVFYDGKKVHELERRVLERIPIPMTRAEALAISPGVEAPGSR